MSNDYIPRSDAAFLKWAETFATYVQPKLSAFASIQTQLTACETAFETARNPNRGKPAHVHGVESRWAVPDNPPHSVENLTKSAFDTASPYTFKFDEVERDKALYNRNLMRNARKYILTKTIYKNIIYSRYELESGSSSKRRYRWYFFYCVYPVYRSDVSKFR
jgi:hypothetical protein